MDYSIKTLQELAIFYRDIDFLARYKSNSIPSLSLIPNFKYLNDNYIKRRYNVHNFNYKEILGLRLLYMYFCVNNGIISLFSQSRITNRNYNINDYCCKNIKTIDKLWQYKNT